MASLDIDSNLPEVGREARAAFGRFPQAIGQAMQQNAKFALKAAITQIDVLIYAMPAADTYIRTKNLRRSNKLEKLSTFTWLIYNDAEYAGYVHDGTSEMTGRPWMANAIELSEPVMERNLVRAGSRALERAG